MEHQSLPDTSSLSAQTIVQLIESLLFVAGEPVTVVQLAKALEVMPDAVESALEELSALSIARGIHVQRTDDRVQLVSAPAAAGVIERFLCVQANPRLSTAALETLAIIAYRQPITRTQIEVIRGVDSGGVIRALLGRELIAEVGRLETAGRPILYTTTDEFLRQFGLTCLADLPSLQWPEAYSENING